MQQHDIDLDAHSDTELRPVPLPAQPAIAWTMVAQQTMLPVATTGRRRSGRSSMQHEGRISPRMRANLRADPGPAPERWRAWAPASTAPAVQMPQLPFPFRSRLGFLGLAWLAWLAGLGLAFWLRLGLIWFT